MKFQHVPKKYYPVILWTCVCFLFGILLFFNVNQFFSESEEDEFNSHRLTKYASSIYEGIDDNQTAFVFGATGIYSTSELFKCMSAIESLSTVGGWKGAVYLLIDKDQCLDKKFIRSLPNKNIKVVKIQKERRRLRETDWPTSNETKGGSPSNNLFNSQPFERSMAVKMHILDYLPPHIQYAAWYDCDVLFIKPHCVKEMIEHKPVITRQRPIFISHAGHVGSFVVRKDVSRDALQDWHKELLASNSPYALSHRAAIPDYQVFINLFGINASDPTSKFGELHKSWHDVLPHGTPETLFAANHSLYWNTSECVVHFSNGRCRHLGPANIDNFLQTLHLRSIGSHKWCPSIIRRKFKTFGIPWPFCWNPPLIWDS